MEWERAKNIILIAFVIVNVVLAGLLFFEDRRYTLSDERMRNIHTVLSNNYINLYLTPARRFAPMRHLDISGFYYDVPALLDIFFDEPHMVIRGDAEPGNYSFFYENRRMDITNGWVFFDNRYNLEENSYGEISRDAAIAIADEFANEHFPDFVRDIVFDEFGGNGVHVRYLQEYREHLIYSNHIEVLVHYDGITWVEMRFGRVIGYGPESRRIFAADEVLLTFMQFVWYEARRNPMFIERMDIVYRKEYASNYEGNVYPAVPFYRIFVQGNDMPFLINAFTNVNLE
jgi:hypothetical protein